MMPDYSSHTTFEATYFKSTIPAAVHGNVRIEKFEVQPIDEVEHAEALKSIPFWSRRVPGRFTRMYIDQTVMMTDLYEEWWSQRHAIQEAFVRGGHILISGLGIGMIIEAILKPHNSPVKHVTVLEANASVIQLVAPHMLARYKDRLEIIHTNALTWTPPKDAHYEAVWHDIWPYPMLVPEEEIDCLRNKFAECSDWQGFWTMASFQE
ncbi:MAG TPA: hypothetical protein P5275_11580 [Saprospiraceae bacterium]|nr:hypothetical protein [Saprospiraceae bacterium]